MTRAQAAAIAKDLVEGGINARYTTKCVAEIHNVSLAAARRIRRVLLRGTEWMAHGPNMDCAAHAAHLCSMVDAIANGWEDQTLELQA